jgi:RimJ/RimL family protein N-acetyltransferase
MAIRVLLPEDAPAFQALRLRGLLEIPSAFTSSHAEEAHTPIPVVAHRITPTADGVVLGAFQADKLVGAVGIQREDQRQIAHKAILWGMYVAPEGRRNGIGRTLVIRALDFAAKELRVRTVNLGVNAENAAAIALYESLGFATYGTEPDFLMINDQLHDEHLMQKVVAVRPPKDLER